MHWQTAVRRIRNGMSVNELVANMPIDDLVARTDYLKQVLTAFQAGHAITHQDAPLTSDTFVGCQVYYSASLGAYAPALASFTVSDTGVVTPSESSYLLGTVLEKSGPNAGTVCLGGYIDGVSISLATGASPATGLWYLSHLEAGKLTRNRPPFAVPAVTLSSDTKYWITPQGGDPHAHQHLVFVLNPEPAGEASGSPYTFSEEWPDFPGWLPADSEVFADKTVPEGAAFGYNIAADGDLSQIWPPNPVSTAKIFFNGSLVRPEQCIIDNDGIWWMTNCTDNVPFGQRLSDCAGDAIGCPPNFCGEHVELHIANLSGLTADAYVTQLLAESPVKVVNCSTGLAATRGHLKVLLEALVESTLASGSVMPAFALTDVNRTTKYLAPTVSGVRASGNAAATGTGDAYTDDEGNVWQTGGVLIHVDDTGDSREGSVELAQLTGVGHASVSGNLYYVMPPAKTSAIRGRIALPTLSFPSPATMYLTFWIVGDAAGALPQLTLSYRRITKSTTITALGTSDTSLANIDPAATVVSAPSYITKNSATFAVAAGDIVLFELGRGSGDGYAGNVGILGLRWAVNPGS